MSEIELKACPFCGPGQSVVGLWHDDVAQRWRVGCGRCGCSTGVSPRDKTEAPAIRAWNTRAPQWQPIESAPKDGATFLAGEFYFADGECVYKECSTAFRNTDGRVYCRDENVEPTHWQPMPAPPEVMA